MSVEDMAKDIKKIKPNDLVMYKVGNFVEVFGKDAKIMSFVFKYKLNKMKSGTYTCGYPKTAIPKVTAKLEERKINYSIVNSADNYNEDQVLDNKNLNTYQENLEKAEKYVKIHNRLNVIDETINRDYWKDNMLDKIRKIEDILEIRYED